MAFSRGPSIVTDGLVLALDAANHKSYPGSGTIWYDRSGNEYNGTLTNGPTFDSGNGGSIVFDGSNDYVSCGTVPFTGNNFSIEVIFKWDSYGTNATDFLIAGNLEQLEIHLGGGSGTNGIRFIPYDYFGANNNGSMDITTGVSEGINYITFTAEYTSPSKFYKNGVLNQTSSTTSTVSLNSTQTITIGARTNTQLPFDGNIYLVKVYNRALSEQEIQQNYNATKSRFGL